MQPKCWGHRKVANTCMQVDDVLRYEEPIVAIVANFGVDLSACHLGSLMIGF